MKMYRKMIEEQLESARNEVGKLPEGKLLSENKNGRIMYIHAYYHDGRYKRKWITSRPDLIMKLARKQYLLTLIGILEEELGVVKIIEEKHIELDAEEVLKRMPAHYRNLPEEYFFSNSYGVIDDMVGSAAEREKAFKKWATEDYERSHYREEEKKHTTTRGLKVRSKSEMMIAQILYAFEDLVVFRYEEILHIGDKTIVPDFVIMDKNGKKYYWEHAGLISDPEYLKRHMQKLELYARAGITMWNNLIVTYDDENGNLDARIIEAIIKNLLIKE